MYAIRRNVVCVSPLYDHAHWFSFLSIRCVCVYYHHHQGVENKRVFELEDTELAAIRAEVEKYTVEGDLRRQIQLNIKRLIDIQCYRGKRHQNRLPVRGQRTKTNARTRKGKSVPVAGKKK